MQDHADDVLADVVHVTLHSGHEDAAITADIAFLLGVHVGQQVGDCLLHDPGRFDHLWQEHLAGAEQVAHHVHAVHERAFYHVQRPVGRLARGLGVFLDKVGNALDQGVFQALVDVPPAPLQVVFLFSRLAVAAVVFGNFQQSLGGLRVAVEDDVLDAFPQCLGYVLVDGQLAGIDNAHVHAVLDGVVEKHRVDGLAYRVVTAEREGHIGDATGHQCMWQPGLDVTGRLDKVDAVVVVFLDTGGNGKDIRVEDDVLGWKADLPGEDLVGACTNLVFAGARVGLTGFIKGHDDGRGTVAPDETRMPNEFLFTFLEADGIHDALALDALQARLEDVPLG